MFRRHCARIIYLFVAACISATIIIALTDPIVAHTPVQKVSVTQKSSISRPPSSLPLQTEPVTDTASSTLQLTEIVSSTPTLLDTIIEATAGTEPAESDAIDQPSTVITEPASTDAAYTDAIDGTVFANRTSASVTFFVEGELYRLAPLRSLGITLRRNPAPLNMFNCDADTPESESTCFWDPYLVEADGFYEVFNKSPEGAPFQLVLQTAGSPPADRIWIQNRSGQREILVFDDQLYELSPATVQEFEVEEGSEVNFYRRSCISINNESACEWIPQQIKTGFYYALSETPPVNGANNSVLSTAEIQPIVAQDGDTQEGEVVEQPRLIVCQIQVDDLNVRSGPGLNYQIVAAVSLNDSATGGRVPAIGRDAISQWIAVDQTIALGGWVTASRQLLVCDGDISTLPITEITDGRLIPTPAPRPTTAPTPTAIQRPIVVAPPPSQNQNPPTAVPEPLPEEQEEIAPTDIAIPAGQIRLDIQNVFDHEVRFTMSPDEYDLQPGETISILRGAGRFTFSVSSPWRGLSGNAELTVEPDESFSMFLYFIPKPGNSDDWEMKFQ